VTAIQSSLVAQPTPETPLVNGEALEAVCRELARLLATDDAAAADLLDSHAEILRGAFGSGYSALERGVQEFEFEAALVALKQGADRIGLTLG
jgi:hypothetical protein